MINAEKYKDEILEAINSKNELSLKKPDGFSFDKYSNKIEPCSDDEYSNCENCLFDDEDLTHSCRYHRTKWLLSEYKEPVKLTRLEYGLLSFWNKEYKYIARDSNNMVFVYREKPSKNSKVWGSLHEHRVIDDLDKLFLFVKWEDTEPRAIKEVLENCEVVDDD